MKKKYVLIICFCVFYLHLFADDISVFRSLVNRILPQYTSSFVIRKLPSRGYDYFQLSSYDKKIKISGNNANSMAVGLNYYLKYYCNAVFSWYADDPFNVPTSLPAIKKPLTITARCKNRFFLNYCTFGYTMPWWNWKKWEHFIDWMALNGINLPLAITGQEVIWRDVWMKLGLSDKEIRKYFTGPSHLPWHRMLNIDYWQGNLPMSWLIDQKELQKKIVSRERELNMHPVLPAFSGHVPQELKRIYPNARITKLKSWGGFPDQYACCFLDPTDPLFAKIQKLFLDEQKKMYGSDHIYGIDLFNELQPPSYETSYLSCVSKHVYSTLKKCDNRAIWLQMTWLFYNKQKNWTNSRIKAYITAYPKNKSFLLDYFCEHYEIWKKTNKYFGVPYIWCYLGNFGGNTILTGSIYDVNKRIENVFKNGGKNFAGIGSTLEGFDCNPIIYEYIFEKAWNIKAHQNITLWTEHLADERVGKVDLNGRAAWKILIDSIYNSSMYYVRHSVMNFRPTFENINKYKSEQLYSNKELLKVVGLLLKVKSRSSSYKYDVINVTRQLLVNYFRDVLDSYIQAYIRYDYLAMKSNENVLMQIIYDTDRLVSCEPSFLLGRWIEEARAKGINEKERLYYEQNARDILTTWGDKGSALTDYANRSWGGLILTYYGERWKMFFSAVNRAVLNGQKLEGVRYEEYKSDVEEYEKRWWYDCVGKFSSIPSRNGLVIANELYIKYKQFIIGR